MRAAGGAGVALAFAGLAVACGGLRRPGLDPTEHVRGEHFRLVQEPPERLWPVLITAVEAAGYRIQRADHERRVLVTGVRQFGPDATRRLGEIADLAEARRAGLRRPTDLFVTYCVFVLPADAASRLKVTSRIQVVDRSQATFFGPGLWPVVPRSVELPSRGVVEREFVRQVASELLTSEEMLLQLGEPGLD
jgi:hypothetical protein